MSEVAPNPTSASSASPRIIAIAGGKGGDGESVIAANLASSDVQPDPGDLASLFCYSLWPGSFSSWQSGMIGGWHF
jgi:hypothetical protein